MKVRVRTGVFVAENLSRVGHRIGSMGAIIEPTDAEWALVDDLLDAVLRHRRHCCQSHIELTEARCSA
jgi:hypothetical protein